MIGGATGYALTLVAVDTDSLMVLVLDPHYCGPDEEAQVVGTQWCSWFACSALFPPNAFFNFCLPCGSQSFNLVEDDHLEVEEEKDWAKLMSVTSTEEDSCSNE